jgi:hypothetical protein
MRYHQIVGIPPSELGGIATPSQDREGEHTRSRSSRSEEHPARHLGHGAILSPLTSIVSPRILITNSILFIEEQAAALKVCLLLSPVGSLARNAD